MTITSPDTEESLCDEYNKYCTEHNLKPLSGDELLYELLCEEDRDKHAVHIKYLEGFIERWEAWEAKEYAEWSAKRSEPIKALEGLVHVTETMVAELNMPNDPTELTEARAVLAKHKGQ